MTNPYQVVAIAEPHIEGFHAVIDEVARERRWLAMLEAPPLEEMRKHVLGNISGGVPHFVALADARVVGWCDCWMKVRPTQRHSAILGMGVVKAHRGQGIGRALLAATLEAARAKGFKRIELAVRVDNESAKKLYDRSGFAVEGVYRRYMFVDGEYKDAYAMALVY
jgi:ribosomal protein S18 acetylase RimI-like enzyme